MRYEWKPEYPCKPSHLPCIQVVWVRQSFYQVYRLFFTVSNFGFIRLVDSIRFQWQRFCNASCRSFGKVLLLRKVIFSLHWQFALQVSRRVVIFLVIAKVFIVGRILSRWVWCSLSIKKLGVPWVRLTQRAPDPLQRAQGPWWWDSARFQALFVAWSWFRQNGVTSSRPPAGNASRWAATIFGVKVINCLTAYLCKYKT